MVKFNKEKVDFGVCGSKDRVQVIYKYEGDDNDIVFIKPGCGCTANCIWNDGELTAIYTADQVVKGTKTVIKSLTVYFDDGKPLKEKNENGVLGFNKNKANLILNFTGTIQGENFLKK